MSLVQIAWAGGRFQVERQDATINILNNGTKAIVTKKVITYGHSEFKIVVMSETTTIERVNGIPVITKVVAVEL